jgi:tetratricopeptide (TPR) repeat protein
LVGVALIIFAATVWLYWPSVHGEFLSGDDNEYLRQSARWNGLTWNAVKWAFTTTAPYYHPLPRLSHVLDYQLWGKNPVGHHATSVFLHALNAGLVFGFLWTLLGAASLTTGERLAMALGVAVAFAIHPLQTESVAWMSGRTQLLCATFGVACLWVYVGEGARRWVVGWLYVAALLCKPMAVSLPFVMLAMDYYPLRRHERDGWGRLLREKAVLIGLGTVAAAAAMITESQKGGLMMPLEKIPLSQRVLLMFQSLVFYVCKLVWPARLSPYYPLRLGLSLTQWTVLASVLSVVAITVVAVMKRRRLPMLAAGWGAYSILVLPASGLVPAGLQSVAMRHAYVAMVPLLLLAGGAAVWAWRRSATVAHVLLISLLVAACGAFAVSTCTLIPVWRNDETWWRAPLAEFPDSELANRLLVGALLAQGKASEALAYAQRDVEIAPQLSKAHYYLAVVLERVGRTDEAIGQYEQTLRIEPDFVEARENLGNDLLHSDRTNEAIQEYQEILWVNPDRPQVHYNLAKALARVGKFPEAIMHYDFALRITPDDALAQNGLAWLLATLAPVEGGDPIRAVALAEQACKVTEFRVAGYLDTLAAAYAAAGRFNDAIITAEKAAKLAHAGNESSLAEKIESRLALYREGRPYHQGIGLTQPLSER